MRHIRDLIRLSPHLLSTAPKEDVEEIPAELVEPTVIDVEAPKPLRVTARLVTVVEPEEHSVVELEWELPEDTPEGVDVEVDFEIEAKETNVDMWEEAQVESRPGPGKATIPTITLEDFSDYEFRVTGVTKTGKRGEPSEPSNPVHIREFSFSLR